jgi:hypothetical protein
MTVDEERAVAALASAKEVDILEAAIADASFLDSTPGENRQKLRGASRGRETAGLNPTSGCSIARVGITFNACVVVDLAAARTRLKKMKADEEAKLQAAIANKDVSPWRKEVISKMQQQNGLSTTMHMVGSQSLFCLGNQRAESIGSCHALPPCAEV